MGHDVSKCCGKEDARLEASTETSGKIQTEQLIDDRPLSYAAEPKLHTVEENVQNGALHKVERKSLTRTDTPSNLDVDPEQPPRISTVGSLAVVNEDDEAESDNEKDTRVLQPSAQEEERSRKEEAKRQHCKEEEERNRQAMLYLPEVVQGVSVLMRVDDDFFCADGSLLRTGDAGLAYRRSKDPHDKEERFLAWGNQIRGVDEGDGWIKIIDTKENIDKGQVSEQQTQPLSTTAPDQKSCCVLS